MRNKRITKSSLGIFSLAFLSVGLGIGCLAGSKSAKVVRAQELGESETMIDFASYEELPSSSFTATLRDCTGTNLSRRYSVTFESTAITAFRSERGDVFSAIDDANYSKSPTEPFVDPTTPEGSDLNGYIYSASANNSTPNRKLFIPRYFYYGDPDIFYYFRINNKAIGANCMTDPNDYAKADVIYICDGFETIEAGAFINVPSTVTIQCGAASKPEGWAEGWTDCDPSRIQFGVPLESSEAKEIYVKTNTSSSFGDADDYILGYHAL